MAFEKKPKEIKLKPDCEDFKPFLFDKEHCKLTAKCANAGYSFEEDCYLRHPDLCLGINREKYEKWLHEKYGGKSNEKI